MDRHPLTPDQMPPEVRSAWEAFLEGLQKRTRASWSVEEMYQVGDASGNLGTYRCLVRCAATGETRRYYWNQADAKWRKA